MTFDDLYGELLTPLVEGGVNVDPSSGSGPEFFGAIIENFSGTKAECLAYITDNVTTWFRCMDKPPLWIQGADWQYWNGKPMVFAGQVNIPYSSGWFHDDVSFFVFYDPDTGVTETVSQIS